MYSFLKAHGTKVLGFFGVTIGVLAVADPALVGGPTAIKYFLLVQSLLTVWRGYFNTDAIKTAEAVKSGIQDGSIVVNKNGGFVRMAMLAVLAVLAVVGTATFVSGCTATREAYKEAQNAPTSAEVVTDTAYVIAEQYSSLVKQAADLKERGTAPASVVSALQAIDKTANPAIHKMSDLRVLVEAGSTAQTQADLQKAVNEAVKIIADFSRQIAKARSGT